MCFPWMCLRVSWPQIAVYSYLCAVTTENAGLYVKFLQTLQVLFVFKHICQTPNNLKQIGRAIG